MLCGNVDEFAWWLLSSWFLGLNCVPPAGHRPRPNCATQQKTRMLAVTTTQKITKESRNPNEKAVARRKQNSSAQLSTRRSGCGVATRGWAFCCWRRLEIFSASEPMPNQESSSTKPARKRGTRVRTRMQRRATGTNEGYAAWGFMRWHWEEGQGRREREQHRRHRLPAGAPSKQTGPSAPRQFPGFRARAQRRTLQRKMHLSGPVQPTIPSPRTAPPFRRRERAESAELCSSHTLSSPRRRLIRPTEWESLTTLNPVKSLQSEH